MKCKKLFVGVATGGVAMALAGGVAIAAWSTTGTGSGAGAATVAVPLTITPVTPSGANASLYPGGPAGGIFVNIKNTNPYAVTLTGVSYGTPTSTSTATCPSANISLATGAPTTVNIAVPANSTATNQEIAGVLSLSHSAPNGCQGVAFDIVVNATGAQQ